METKYETAYMINGETGNYKKMLLTMGETCMFKFAERSTFYLQIAK